jgi:hypothetical protein
MDFCTQFRMSHLALAGPVGRNENGTRTHIHRFAEYDCGLPEISMMKIVLVAIARIHVSAMFLQVVCPHCKHPFEIDDADCTANACPNCDGEWGCNVDAEPAWEADLEFDVPSHHQTIDSDGQLVDDWQRIAAKPRSRRRESSLLSKILPPILGGLTAVPIALAILWYGFGKDLGNAGPTVARYAPWMVPGSLQGIAKRNANIQRAKPTKPRIPLDFGELASQSQDRSGNDVPELVPFFEPSPSDPSDISPVILKYEYKRFEKNVEFIEEVGKQWEVTPIELRTEIQRAVYQTTLKLAGIVRKRGSWMDCSMPKFKSWVDLIEQGWYADAIEKSASEFLTEEQPPEFNQVVVWPVKEITLNAKNDPLDNCNLEPPLTIGTQAVHWFADEPIAEQIRTLLPIPSLTFIPGIGPAPSSGRRLVIGRIEHIEEYGYFIRIEAIIPH